MLRFFRRIRRKLLDQGSFRKYLVYAIGEIFLVMIGILLALQVNNWNTERGNRELEKYYLDRIIQDLTADSVLLERLLYANNRSLVLMEAVLTTMGNGPIHMRKDTIVMEAHAMFPDIESLLIASYPFRRFQADSLEQSFTEQLDVLKRIRFFYPTESTFQELLSNGKLEVVKDRKLRAAIMGHYTNIPPILRFQALLQNPVDEYSKTLYMNNISPLTTQTYDQLKVRLSDEQILSTATAIENLYATLIITMNSFIYSETSVKKRTIEMITKIKNYRSEL